MGDIVVLPGRWELVVRDARERMYRAPTPRERERWHAPWLLAQGWPACKVAELLERDAHTIGSWLAAFVHGGAAALAFVQRGGSPPALEAEAQAGLKLVVQATPAEVGINLANWNWRVVRQFIAARCGVCPSRRNCLRYPHRPGFVYKRPKKRLLKADAEKRAAFVTEYAALLAEARTTGAQVFFADEAHFRADGGLRGKWVLKGQPALADSTCPRWGEKASYYSAVCLETGEMEHMDLTGTRPGLPSLRNCAGATTGRWWSSGTTAQPMGARRCATTWRRRISPCGRSACPRTAPTSSPTRRSGPGRTRNSPPTPASGPRRKCRSG